MFCITDSPTWVDGAGGTKSKWFLRFLQNAYFPAAEFMDAYFSLPSGFQLGHRVCISILSEWQCKILPQHQLIGERDFDHQLLIWI